MIDRASTISTNRFVDLLSQDGTVWLDSNSNQTAEGGMLFANPLYVIEAATLCEVLEAFRKADQAIRSGRYVAGYVAYEAGYAFEASLRALEEGMLSDGRPQTPLVWFGVYDHPNWIQGMDLPKSHTDRDLLPLGLEPTEDREAYGAAVSRIRSLIEEGDVYQINYTTRFSSAFSGDPVGLYRSLRSQQPVQYGAFLRIPDCTVLSFSPELFFSVDQEQIEARPMKGTAARGQTAELDAQLKTWLASDAKNRAENLMIVDLLRNDLSIVCQPGSVTVPHLFNVETHPTVHQMTSTVQGQLQPEVNLEQLFGALFPCGSITGAPKIRAMKRIAELESSPRGIYCGAIGYAAPTPSSSLGGLCTLGKAAFSVAIRTATLLRRMPSDEIPFNEVPPGEAPIKEAPTLVNSMPATIWYGSGGGVVWDSDPNAEYEEAVLKTAFLKGEPRAPLQLIETMLWDGSFPFLKYHVARIQDSSRALGFTYNPERFQSELQQHIRDLDSALQYRIRVLLSPDGEFLVESTRYERPTAPVEIGLSSGRISASDPFIRHKTTERKIYERAREEAERRSLFDVVLTNERGEVTEGSITNVFAKINGQWFTPPLHSGILPGIGRRVFMLESGAQERILTAQDLKNADELRVTNALLGGIQATWTDRADQADRSM